MKNKDALHRLRYISAFIGSLSYLETIPFIPHKWSVPIIGFAFALKPVFEKVGDWLDNKKFDGSFKI